MTPNDIAGMAALNGLTLLALTDHNSSRNCPAFFEACKRQGIVPIAGMELTTAEDIHLVCLFRELESAMAFSSEIEKHLMPIKNRPEIFGDQLVLDGEDNVIDTVDTLLLSATDLYMADALELARSYGAHVRPAHIDRESNGMISILGDVPTEYGFSCVELKDKENAEQYFKNYPSLDGKGVIVSSDAHHLWEINEAENYFMIDDEPYSSAYVRKKLFELLEGKN